MEKVVYDEFYNLERTHWWFVSRQRIFIGLINKYLQKKGNNKILDIGCGTGMNMDNCSKFGFVYGLDLSMDALNYCSQKGYPLTQANILNLPYKSLKFDIITALDIVEHVKDDVAALKEVYRVCNYGGIFIIAVPAFQFLWGEHDWLTHHVRRYTLPELRESVNKSGFKIKKISYNNFLLFPVGLIFRYVKILMRFLHKERKFHSDFEKTSPPIVNSILKLIYSFEGWLLKYINFPYGLSIVCVCEKADNT